MTLSTDAADLDTFPIGGDFFDQSVHDQPGRFIDGSVNDLHDKIWELATDAFQQPGQRGT